MSLKRKQLDDSGGDGDGGGSKTSHALPLDLVCVIGTFLTDREHFSVFARISRVFQRAATLARAYAPTRTLSGSQQLVEHLPEGVSWSSVRMDRGTDSFLSHMKSKSIVNLTLKDTDWEEYYVNPFQTTLQHLTCIHPSHKQKASGSGGYCLFAKHSMYHLPWMQHCIKLESLTLVLNDHDRTINTEVIPFHLKRFHMTGGVLDICDLLQRFDRHSALTEIVLKDVVVHTGYRGLSHEPRRTLTEDAKMERIVFTNIHLTHDSESSWTTFVNESLKPRTRHLQVSYSEELKKRFPDRLGTKKKKK